jgi:Family of unknown function (DUF6113)
VRPLPGRRAPVPDSLLCVDSTPAPSPARPDAFTTGAAYAALFLLGAAEALVGCFQYSRSAGTVPVAALVFCALIFLTCVLGGQGMGSVIGGVVPALGWFLASLVLTMPTAGGSVIVTNSSAGKWYLYGGAVSAALGVILSFRIRPRRAARSRAGA